MSQIQSKPGQNFKAINLACGGKLCHLPGWVNADHSPSNKKVMQVNLLRPLPFDEHTFDVVYHSQFIEHLPMDQARLFLHECYRVLKPNGVLRVVTPDLKNQAAEYLVNLQRLLRDPDSEDAQLRYDWLRLEMLDQLTRQETGGEMVSFLAQSGSKIQRYLRERLGASSERLLPSSLLSFSKESQSFKDYLRSFRDILKNVVEILTPKSYQVGSFRLSGEVHLCMYDQYLLSTLLLECQFVNINLVNAVDSKIQDWASTLLDLDEHGNSDCPASLFIEAVKAPQAL